MPKFNKLGTAFTCTWTKNWQDGPHIVLKVDTGDGGDEPDYRDYRLTESEYIDFSEPPYNQKKWANNDELTARYDDEAKKYRKGGWLRDYLRASTTR